MLGNATTGQLRGGAARLADHADDDTTRRSIGRQVRGVVIGTVLLVVIFLSATAHAVFTIDGSSVGADRARAEAMAALVIDAGRGASNKMVREIATVLELEGARLTSPDRVASDEAFVALTASGDTVMAFTPRRLGTETFYKIAPIRVTIAAAVITGIVLILHRLYTLARHIDRRRIEARELAVRDPLTGLSNRLAFNDGLERRLAASTGERRAALLLLDLDDFKAVNDRFGHIAGDRLLQEVAERLRAHAAPDDAVARLGGDEFAIVRRTALTRRDLTEFAGGLISLISAPYQIDGHHATVSVSIGIARIDEATAGAEALVRAADAALYRAKARPGGAYEFEAPTSPRPAGFVARNAA